MSTLTIKQIKILNLLKEAESCVERLEQVRRELENSLSEQNMKKVA